MLTKSRLPDRMPAGERPQQVHTDPGVPLRIWMVNLVALDEGGGDRQHQLGLMHAWSDAGHDVRMISPRVKDVSAVPNHLRSRLLLSPNLREVGLPPSLNTLLQVPMLVRQRFSFQPDVVYTRVNMLTPVLVAACRALGFYVVTEHNSWLKLERGARGGHPAVAVFEDKSQVLAARWSQMSRTVTKGIADRIHENGVPRNRLYYIGNGTDIGQFHPIQRSEALAEFGLDPHKTYLGFIGNIMPWHGVETAVAAFKILAPSDPQLELLIVGDGPQREELESRVRVDGLADRAHFLGRLSADRANAAINCFDIALLPLSERYNVALGFSSTKLRDYAAAGRLVVCGHLPGNIELRDKGWLFTHIPDDPSSLAEAIRERLADRSAWPAASCAARAYAEKHFAWEKIVEQIIDVIRSAQNQAR